MNGKRLGVRTRRRLLKQFCKAFRDELTISFALICSLNAGLYARFAPFPYQFETLDENVQSEFERFLEERGIATSLALFIPNFAEYKEQRGEWSGLDTERASRVVSLFGLRSLRPGSRDFCAASGLVSTRSWHLSIFSFCHWRTQNSSCSRFGPHNQVKSNADLARSFPVHSSHRVLQLARERQGVRRRLKASKTKPLLNKRTYMHVTTQRAQHALCIITLSPPFRLPLSFGPTTPSLIT